MLKKEKFNTLKHFDCHLQSKYDIIIFSLILIYQETKIKCVLGVHRSTSREKLKSHPSTPFRKPTSNNLARERTILDLPTSFYRILPWFRDLGKVKC